jgi:hypothetical protein
VSIWGRVATRIADDSKLEAYKPDPALWAGDKLDAHLWSKQRDIMASLIANRRTAVQSCRDSGKSFTAGLAACWWIDNHEPGSAFVVSTAPTYPQVHAILWEEIRKQHRRGGLPARVLDSGSLMTAR